MRELKAGEFATESTTVPVVPSLSPSTVVVIRDRLMRNAIRKQREIALGFFEMGDGTATMFELRVETGELIVSPGVRPPLVEVIRPVDKIIHSEMKTP